MSDVLNIAGRIHSISEEGVSTTADEILDESVNKKQSVINQEVGSELATHESRLNALTSQNYVTVTATSGTTAVTDVLPAEGAMDTVYRVGSWNGTQYNPTTYSEYAWTGVNYMLLDVKEYGIDDEPVAGSENLVKSGGVQKELALGVVYDVSAKNPTAGTNNDGKWESLSALLKDADLDTLIPTSVRKGGMSIKFVQSSDNKYVQFFLTKDEWSVGENYWQKMNLEEEVSQLDQETDELREEMDGNYEIETDITSLFNFTSPNDGTNKFINANPNSGTFGNERDDTTQTLRASNFANLSLYAGETLRITFCSKKTQSNAGLVFFGSSSVSSRYSGVRFPLASEDGTYPYTLDVQIPTQATFIRTTYVKNNIEGFPAFSAKIISSGSKGKLQEQINTLKATKVPIKYGSNIFDKDAVDIQNGKYIYSDGSIQSNADYKVSDYIPIEPETDYHLSQKFDDAVGASNVYAAFYNSTKTIIGSALATIAKNFTSPENAAFFRFTYKKDAREVQFEKGQSRTDYSVYSIIGGYPVNIPAGCIQFASLADVVSSKVKNRFDSFTVSGMINNAESISNPITHVKKNILLSALVKGTIDSFYLGNSKTGNEGSYIILTQTVIEHYSIGNSITLVESYNHGLALTNETVVQIESTLSSTNIVTVRIITDNGSVFEHVLQSWGVGIPFASNEGTTALYVKLSFYPRDLKKKIWIFGDSYLNFDDSKRWPYYAKQAGFIDWLVNAQSGQSPSSALADLQNLLAACPSAPSIVLWTLGMNGDATESLVDGNYVINSQQKSVIDNVVNLSKTYGFEPIFVCVPTVPERQKTGFCNYIRNLGYRYIDFADAVGANSNGQWTTGLISSDNVHPTELGAKVLFSRVLVDFPEIAIID